MTPVQCRMNPYRPIAKQDFHPAATPAKSVTTTHLALDIADGDTGSVWELRQLNPRDLALHQEEEEAIQLAVGEGARGFFPVRVEICEPQTPRRLERLQVDAHHMRKVFHHSGKHSSKVADRPCGGEHLMAGVSQPR